MKSNSIKSNLYPYMDAAALKKVWAKPEVELISILSGTGLVGPEGQPSIVFLRTYHS